MNKFATRSTQRELIDDPGLPFSDWEVCLRELNTVNTWLGGHAITLEGVRKILPRSAKSFWVAEIGCGGGDNLNAIHRNFRKINARYTGVDINQACIDFAEENCRHIPLADFICSDYKLVNFGDEKPDIIFNSLFCHHFSNEQLIEMLKWMKENSRVGFFINDLHRHPVAYYSIKFLTRIFSKSYLVRHDGHVSVARGFKKNEWEQLLKSAGIKEYSINWRWAFRYLVIVKNE